MQSSCGRFNETARLIGSARLTPTEHSLWRAFLNESVDREYAAQYIWERIHDHTGRSVEKSLIEIKLEWKQVVSKLARRDPVPHESQTLVANRDGSQCFMMDPKPSKPSVPVHFDYAWVIPPSLSNDSDMNSEGPLYTLLQAFLTPAITSKLQSSLQRNTSESRLRNLLLLSPSIHSAFRAGHLHLFPITNSADRWNDDTETKIKTASKVYYFVSRIGPEPCGSLFLSDSSAWDRSMQMFIMESRDDQLPLPDPFLLRTHFRFSTSLHLFHVEESISRGWPSPPLIQWNLTTQKSLRSLWHLMPRCIRTQCYTLLIKLGSYLYPRSFTGLVHRLPFGLYAKECAGSSRNEAEALHLVEKYTSIPAPLWVDDYQQTHPILIMTAVPGQTLDKVFHRLSYFEREQLSKDLKSLVHGGPLRNHRFPSGTCGPFSSIFDFNAFLVHAFVRQETIKKISTVHARTYRSVFTHADVHPSNIIIDRGRLSGIVDWECAGFYPEYWEFTKLMYGAEMFPEFRQVIRQVFSELSYDEELEAETLLWNDTPFGI
ncbi:hypothetical protein PEBR_38700 [Penicillium brasilianum]|uniref:Aminoglycoside phosphotransferase domain-containing protein n=1 Tax=Penicillium brasilianum TaxID=104259 RepID=A0A1S9RAC8_PENBI|nr:hypothetical protein PEBR_38700 [Penicillium brasilianum]